MSDRFYLLQNYGLGWYYLSSFLDDYSRFIVHWKLCKSMQADDSIQTIEAALMKSNLTQAPKLLSDNGSSYIAADFKDYLQRHNIKHIRGSIRHPQTREKLNVTPVP